MKHKTTPYILRNGGVPLVFESEKAACEYLGVAPCSVASCFRRGSLCRGYSIEKALSESDVYNDKRLRKIWGSMHERCERASHEHFRDYGGRGISVCEEWREYLPFAKWAIQNGYRDELTIDRIDTNAGYSPENCRWATYQEQANNKRNNRKVEYCGQLKTVAEWSAITGVGGTTIRERLNAGWPVEDALTRPVRARKTGYRPSKVAMREDGRRR